MKLTQAYKDTGSFTFIVRFTHLKNLGLFDIDFLWWHFSFDLRK